MNCRLGEKDTIYTFERRALRLGNEDGRSSSMLKHPKNMLKHFPLLELDPPCRILKHGKDCGTYRYLRVSIALPFQETIFCAIGEHFGRTRLTLSCSQTRIRLRHVSTPARVDRAAFPRNDILLYPRTCSKTLTTRRYR